MNRLQINGTYSHVAFYGVRSDITKIQRSVDSNGYNETKSVLLSYHSVECDSICFMGQQYDAQTNFKDNYIEMSTYISSFVM